MNRTLPNRTRLRSGGFQPPRFRRTGFQPVPAGSRSSAARRGSVIIVVIGLLGALMLLGFLFLTLSLQEEESARYYSEAQKVTQTDPNAFFNWTLEQLTVGAPDARRDSVLWGGRFSLLATLLGSDMVPHDGAGVNLLITGGETSPIPLVDQNMDLLVDPPAADTGHYAALNISPGSIVPVPAFNPNKLVNVRANWPEPDTGYTYPDMNSPFLTFEQFEPNDGSGDRVVLPAFHRPQMLRGRTGPYTITSSHSLLADDWYNPGDWYTNPATLPYVFRPHRERRAVATSPSGDAPPLVLTDNDPWTRRFVTRAAAGGHPDVDQQGNVVPADDPDYVPPFDGIDADGDGDPEFRDLLNLPSEGHWRYSLVADGSGTKVPDVRHPYDGDPDNDGLYDSVWLDLGYPAQETAGGGLFVPLFLVKLVDADALFNLNAHGNAYGELTPAAMAATDISRSDEGLGPHEVNPIFGLTAAPVTGDPALKPHADVFGGAPTNARELANVEWWFALAGNGTQDGGGVFDAVNTGRWGEPRVLATALNNGATVDERLTASPRPGLTGRVGGTYADDDGDALVGLTRAAGGTPFTPGIDPRGSIFPPTVGTVADGVPVDRRGTGTHVGGTPATAGDRLFAAPPNPTDAVNSSRFRFPEFRNYYLPMIALNAAQRLFAPRWAEAVANGSQPRAGGHVFGDDYSGFMANYEGTAIPLGLLNIDEPDETITDFRAARGQRTDDIFGPEETAALQLSDRDRTISDLDGADGSRLSTLLPINFRVDGAAERIRGRFATASFDTHSSTATDAVEGGANRPKGLQVRAWEFNQPVARPRIDPDNPPALVAAPLPRGEFPPTFRAGGTDAVAYWPYDADPYIGLARSTTANFDPFREEVRALLRTSHMNDPAREQTRALFHKLSANHVLERVTNPADPFFDADAGLAGEGLGELRFRPPTPHPTGLNADPVGRGPLGAGAGTTFPAFGLPDAVLGRLEAAAPATADGYTTWSIQTAAQQEWHARRDRQNMARDIYVLLWTLGGFDDGTPGRDFTQSNAGNALYTELEMREMAQFAVNLVDALDPDGVMTVFVYDKDLADGYTAADDGYSDPLPMPGDVDFDRTMLDAERGMVTGVERQDLVLGEAMFTLAWGSEDAPGGRKFYDHKLTEWDDRGVQDFSFIEVANVGPNAVNFADANNPEQWQIVVRAPRVPDDPATDPHVQTRTLVPTAGSLTPDRPYHVFAASNTGANIDGAGNQRPARLRVNLSDTEDENSTGQVFPHHIAPYHFVNPGPDQNGRDLMTQDGYRLFREDGNEMPGDRKDWSTKFVEFANLTADPTEPPPDTLDPPTVEVLLQRRLNPRRAVPDRSDTPRVDDNPWVTVDSLRVKPSKLDARKEADNDKTTGEGEFQATFIPGVQGGEPPDMGPIARVRRRPLLRASELAVESRAAGQPSTTGGPNVVPGKSLANYVFNSLGGHDRLSPPTFTLWQPHGDRAFGSLADVLRVPLYPPSRIAGLPLETDPLYNVADALAYDFELPTGDTARQCGLGVSSAPAAATPPPTLNRATVAADRMLFPDRARGAWPQTEPQPPGPLPPRNRSRYNLWWRLFQFLEPARHEAEMTRTPGIAVRVGPTDRERQAGEDQFDAGHTRTAGRMNLNTLRDPHHLAGLLDDVGLTHGRPADPPTTVSPLPGQTIFGPGFANADWWQALVLTRDGYDAVLDDVGPSVQIPARILPGLPPRYDGTNLLGGTPFRGTGGLRWDVTADPALGLRRNFSESILRRVGDYAGVAPNATTAPQNLFAVDPAVNTLEEPATADYDYTTRYRLLGKLLNTTTVRSNVFLCWIQVDFFHARRLRVDGSGALAANGSREITRVGNIREDSPGYRGFFVIDRSRALDLIEEKHLPRRPRADLPIGPDVDDPATPEPDHIDNSETYSFRRDDLSGGPRFPWQELILYRRLIQ